MKVNDDVHKVSRLEANTKPREKERVDPKATTRLFFRARASSWGNDAMDRAAVAQWSTMFPEQDS